MIFDVDESHSLSGSLLIMDGFEKLQKLYKMTSNVFLNEEDFLAYRLGGFHPVSLGDTLKDGRYKIYHKLGYGGFSTVWVAKDYRYVTAYAC